MNEKAIKKVLNAKLSAWYESIDDEAVKETVKENTIITGGCFVSLLNNEDVNDFDVYFKTKEACKRVAEYYVSKFNTSAKSGKVATVVEDEGRITVFISSVGVAEEEKTENVDDEGYVEGKTEESENKPKYRPIWLSSNAITLSDKIQIVVRFYGEPKEIHENYDFIHCMIFWSSWDNFLSLPEKSLVAIINKELFYCGSKYPVCSIMIARKFLSRGWKINAGQYLKMALQISKLDLTDVKILRDQLVGVDSYYFNQAIDFIENKQEEDKDFKIDNPYLFEIINKIF
jgi:hypothetical protein